MKRCHYLEDIFNEMADIIADFQNDKEDESELLKSIIEDTMNKYSLSKRERNYLCERVSSESDFTF